MSDSLPLFIPPDSPDLPENTPRPAKTAQPVQRKRGGQPGNRNARKHGFYSSKFPTSDRKALETTTNGSLNDEIDMLRLYIRLVISDSAGDDPAVKDRVAVLRALTQASTALTRLLKTQRKDFSQPDFEERLRTKCAEVLAEMRSEPWNPNYPYRRQES
jgi:hypothetical protein